MWRQNQFKNVDSDQSISDEDELEVENSVSSTEKREKEDGMQIQSRLDSLIGLNGPTYVEDASNKKQRSSIDEDELEIPETPDEVGQSSFKTEEPTRSLDEYIVSEDEYGDKYIPSKSSVSSVFRKLSKDCHTFEYEKQTGATTWNIINKEAEALITLNQNSSTSSATHFNTNKCSKDVQGKPKRKFSFHFQSHKDGPAQPLFPTVAKGMSITMCQEPENLEAFEHEHIENFSEENEEHIEIIPFEAPEYEEEMDIIPFKAQGCCSRSTKNSVADQLDGLREKSNLLVKIVPRRGKSMGLLKKGTLGDRIMDMEDQLELMASDSSSDEKAAENLNLAITETRNQTMADQFQEALASTCLSNGREHLMPAKIPSFGLFGKLQKVMQKEKERDTDFMEKLQMGSIPNNESCSIIVEILSRCLEAKLTVCYCITVKTMENADTLEDIGKKRTVIFSPRVCSDVDLEVGNLIHIHPPWKEIKVTGNEESIMLCTYFFQL